jgi:hypothetical protein
MREYGEDIRNGYFSNQALLMFRKIQVRYGASQLKPSANLLWHLFRYLNKLPN